MSAPFVVTSEATGADWELVIGLEVHAELATATKMFSSAPNEFGGEPNTHIDPVTLGLPGSLPVLNERAVELGIRVGVALHCDVRRSTFARKNYFYPDMPKDYQISQYDEPLNVDGNLELSDGTVVGIERAHLEEDTGKSTHQGGDGRIHGAASSLVDYNRAGVPLIEIVGRPDLRSPEDARAYVSELRSILVAIGASDGKMEEGSLRVDANVSVRPVGSDQLGTRCEIKNVNSLRSLGRAIEYEARRQVEVLEAGERVVQETRHWDEEAGRTRAGRSKEQAEDYRYFLEPDLVVLDPSPELVESIRSALPALPAERRARLAAQAGVAGSNGSQAAVALAVERGLDDLALATIAAGAPADRVLHHLEHNLAVDGASELDADQFAELVRMEGAGELTATQVKTVLAEMVATGTAPGEVAKAKGFEAMAEGALDQVVDEVIAAHPDDWAEFVAADDKKRGKLTSFFVGKVMAAMKGQADGKEVNRILNQRRSSS
jgi:aspartyl-tRNA(Asn)/glutamyl-tRNA(Gln) amidotransferase subunit B